MKRQSKRFGVLVLAIALVLLIASCKDQGSDDSIKWGTYMSQQYVQTKLDSMPAVKIALTTESLDEGDTNPTTENIIMSYGANWIESRVDDSGDVVAWDANYVYTYNYDPATSTYVLDSASTVPRTNAPNEFAQTLNFAKLTVVGALSGYTQMITLADSFKVLAASYPNIFSFSKTTNIAVSIGSASIACDKYMLTVRDTTANNAKYVMTFWVDPTTGFNLKSSFEEFKPSTATDPISYMKITVTEYQTTGVTMPVTIN